MAKTLNSATYSNDSTSSGTWYTILSYSGKGVLTQISGGLYDTANNYLYGYNVHFRVTVDGGTAREIADLVVFSGGATSLSYGCVFGGYAQGGGDRHQGSLITVSVPFVTSILVEIKQDEGTSKLRGEAVYYKL